MREASRRLSRCLWCGESYEPYREWQKFCSAGCRKNEYQTRRHAAAREAVLAELEHRLPDALVQMLPRIVDKVVCMVRSELGG